MCIDRHRPLRVNEAFASVVLRFMPGLRLDPTASWTPAAARSLWAVRSAHGAMILGTALDELERTGKGTALVTFCIGGGMGTATIIERV